MPRCKLSERGYETLSLSLSLVFQFLTLGSPLGLLDSGLANNKEYTDSQSALFIACILWLHTFLRDRAVFRHP